MRNFIIEQFYKQRSDFEKSCVEREQKYPLPDGVKCTENIATEVSSGARAQKNKKQ